LAAFDDQIDECEDVRELEELQGLWRQQEFRREFQEATNAEMRPEMQARSGWYGTTVSVNFPTEVEDLEWEKEFAREAGVP
jgi:hypothetical protein